MGNRLVKFEFCPDENEQIEATVIVPKETRSVIHGIVKNYKNKTVKDAVVKLYEVIDFTDRENYTVKPITHTFTDEFGQFLFGPLCAKKHYIIKVWINDIKVREIVISADKCDEPDSCNSCHRDEVEDERPRRKPSKYPSKYRDEEEEGYEPEDEVDN